MFAADADFEFRLGCTAFFNAHLDELANAFLIENFEGIGLDDAVFLVELEELGSVVARETEGHLGKVVGTKGEEVGHGCDLIGAEGCTGNLDHGADLVVNVCAFFLEYLGCSDVDHVGLMLDFFE